MRNLILSLFLTIAAVPAFAANLDGVYACDDQGTLELDRKSLTSFQASLTYEDGAVSTLDVLEFHSADSMVATMLPDDEGRLGRARIIRNGIVLKFDNGDVVTCLKK
jgi:hypothetical protein